MSCGNQIDMCKSPCQANPVISACTNNQKTLDPCTQASSPLADTARSYAWPLIVRILRRSHYPNLAPCPKAQPTRAPHPCSPPTHPPVLPAHVQAEHGVLPRGGGCLLVVPPGQAATHMSVHTYRLCADPAMARARRPPAPVTPLYHTGGRPEAHHAGAHLARSTALSPSSCTAYSRITLASVRRRTAPPGCEPLNTSCRPRPCTAGAGGE